MNDIVQIRKKQSSVTLTSSAGKEQVGGKRDEEKSVLTKKGEGMTGNVTRDFETKTRDEKRFKNRIKVLKKVTLNQNLQWSMKPSFLEVKYCLSSIDSNLVY